MGREQSVLSPQGFLCKQWLEKFLEGCRLPFPLAFQPGGEGRVAVVLLGALGLQSSSSAAPG